MDARVIGEREFTDGVVRRVYEDDQGQYVLDADGEIVRGVWLLPADEAFMVETLPGPEQSHSRVQRCLEFR
jgi:hypothetical protein